MRLQIRKEDELEGAGFIRRCGGAEEDDHQGQTNHGRSAGNAIADNNAEFDGTIEE